MKRFKFSVFFMALSVAVISAFAFNTSPKKDEVKLITVYHYNNPSQDIADLVDPVNWTEGAACGSSGSKVCSFNYTGNRSAFDTYIASFTTQPNMLAAAQGKKN